MSHVKDYSLNSTDPQPPQKHSEITMALNENLLVANNLLAMSEIVRKRLSPVMTFTPEEPENYLPEPLFSVPLANDIRTCSAVLFSALRKFAYILEKIDLPQE